VNNYEALVILDATAKEESQKEVIDRIQKEIEAAGGRVSKVQKLGVKPLAHLLDKHSAGSYVNYVFSAPGHALAVLDAKFLLDTDVLRWQFLKPTEVPAKFRNRVRKPRPAAAVES
jgi:ribosomal protein S6